MSFISHELAINEDIQQRLYEEVAETAESLDGQQITYEALQKMKYLDMVVSETLRKWPIGVMSERKVSKQYLFENSDGTKALLMPNEAVWIPTFAIHRDPEYYPNPTKFDPERFSAENKHKINQGAYLPFGIGPRACVASRFALMQTKATVYHLLLNFKLECGAKTVIPLKLKASANSMDAEGGFWLNFKHRNQS